VKNLAKLAVPLAVAVLLASQTGPAAPCGFHGAIGNNFSALHPKSIDVALAVRDAVVAGVIEQAADPAAVGNAGYWRAVGHLTTLHAALAGIRKEASAPISVLFIDSGLWARLTPKADGLTMEIHTAGVQPGDVAVITSETVLTAILEKRLPVADALESGVIAIDGEAADATRHLIAKALDATARPVASSVETGAIRLFGPSRNER
jgi:hypothetical protein